MNNKNLASLTLILAILIGLFYLSNNVGDNKQVKSKKQSLFSDMEISSIRGLEVKRKDNSVVLELVDSVWTVSEKENYPADFGKVKSLLLKVLELSVSQEVTNDENRYADLGVDSSNNTFSHGEIIFKGSTGDTLGSLILGKFRAPQNLSNPTLGTGQFIKRNNSKSVYLISEPVSLTMGDVNWLDKDLANVNSLRVKAVNQTKQDKTVFDLNKGEAEFELSPKPLSGHEVNDANVKLLTSALENFKLEDVKREQDEGTKFDTLTTFKINNGLIFKIKSFEKKPEIEKGKEDNPPPNDVFVKISVEKDEQLIEELNRIKAEAASMPEGEKPRVFPPVTEEEYENLKKKFTGWVFKVPAYGAKSKFRFDLADMTRKIEKEPEAATEPAAK